MLGLLFRLAAFAAALIGVALLFVYAAVVAVIFVPVVLVVLWMLRRKGIVRWTTVDLRGAQYQSPGNASYGGSSNGRSPVIDHDPNDVTLDRKP